MDVLPSLLYFTGLEIPAGLDGAVPERAIKSAHLAERPLRFTEAVEPAGRDKTSPYSSEDQALIEERLRGLGYL
jgi:hypothetical protein